MVKSIDAKRLYEDLLRQINSSELLPGTMIPSENELALRYAISRPTVRKVLGTLCSSGMLEKRIGKGTFVNEIRKKDEEMPDRPFNIGIGMPGFSGVYYSDVMQSIGNMKCKQNIYLNLLDLSLVAKGVIPEHLDGVLLITDRLPERAYDEFQRRNIPVIHFNRRYDIPGVGYVAVDNAFEAERAVSYMFRAGCRRVAVIGSRRDPANYASYFRTSGWEEACRKFLDTVPRELELSAEEISRGDFFSALDAAEPDAFFFVNMSQFNRFKLEYGRHTGKSVEDTFFIIFDDMDREFPERYITANFLRMPIKTMIAESIKYLWQKKNDFSIPELRREFACELVIRREK